MSRALRSDLPRDQPALVLAALRDGPGTSVELSAETGLPVKHCSAVLRALVAQGKVRDTGGRLKYETSIGCNSRPAFIYEAI